MKKTLRTMIAVMLALVFVGSSTMVLRQLYEQHLAREAYEEAAGIALTAPSAESTEPTDPVQESLDLPEPQLPLAEEPEEVSRPLPEQAQYLLDVDLETLRATNADVLGWIYIPDTDISYPLMRSKDNDEYLGLTWDLKRSAAGSIFLECRNSADLSDFNTLIYGHNMKNGSMFSGLHDFQDQTFAHSHPYVYVATDDAVLQYEVFSAYTADVTGDTYRLYFEDDARKQSAIDFYLERSELETDLVPTVDDRILTLSTCTGLGDYDYRWVVQTVLTGEYAR